MKADYQIADPRDTRRLAEFLQKEGQLLLPMLDLVERAELAIDEVIDVLGRASIEAILSLSAERVAGPKQQGKEKPQGEVLWHGHQRGVVSLKERKLRVQKPRLRKRGSKPGGEVEIPAYEAMRGDQRLADRMLEILLSGVSTRRYREVLPEMAEQVGVSKSSVSRETIEAGERLLRSLAERRFDEIDVLIVYVDGIQFGQQHVLAAVGVDSEGNKHVLGLRQGASENAEVATALLEELVERGIQPGRRRLFVIDGSKALRKAVNQVFGAKNPVQRCRAHKQRNVLGHLPKDQHDPVRSTIKAAWKLDAEDGIKKLKDLAVWLERDHPSAAASLKEGLDEMFTINRLGLPATLRRCLGTTNIIDSAHSGVRQRTRRVTHWEDGSMALRWAAAAFVETEKSFRKILGYHQLWILKAHLDETDEVKKERRKVG